MRVQQREPRSRVRRAASRTRPWRSKDSSNSRPPRSSSRRDSRRRAPHASKAAATRSSDTSWKAAEGGIALSSRQLSEPCWHSAAARQWAPTSCRRKHPCSSNGSRPTARSSRGSPRADPVVGCVRRPGPRQSRRHRLSQQLQPEDRGPAGAGGAGAAWHRRGLPLSASPAGEWRLELHLGQQECRQHRGRGPGLL